MVRRMRKPLDVCQSILRLVRRILGARSTLKDLVSWPHDFARPVSSRGSLSRHTRQTKQKMDDLCTTAVTLGGGGGG